MSSYHIVNFDHIDINLADDAFELKQLKDDELRVYNQDNEYKFVIDLMKHRSLIDFRKTVIGVGLTEIIILIQQSAIPNQFIMFIKKILAWIKYGMNGHALKAYMTQGLIFFETNDRTKDVILADTLEVDSPEMAKLEFNIVIKKFTAPIHSIDSSQDEVTSVYWLSLLATDLRFEGSTQANNYDDKIIWI